MQQQDRHVLHTYWRASDRKCELRCSLPGMAHSHSDGGLIIWKAGPLVKIAQDIGDFAHFAGAAT